MTAPAVIAEVKMVVRMFFLFVLIYRVGLFNRYIIYVMISSCLYQQFFLNRKVTKKRSHFKIFEAFLENFNRYFFIRSVSELAIYLFLRFCDNNV